MIKLLCFQPEESKNVICGSQAILVEIDTDKTGVNRAQHTRIVTDLHFEDGRNGPWTRYDAALHGIEQFLAALVGFGILEESAEANAALDMAIRDIWDKFNDT